MRQHAPSATAAQEIKAQRLLLLLVATFVPAAAPLELVVDEHLERRWGPKITKRGHYRDPLLSGKGLNVANSGLRWVVLALVVHVPWTARHWALPFLAVYTYGSIELGLLAHDKKVALMSPIRMDANLFAPAPARQPGQNGRPRVKGAALPKLEQILRDPQTAWTNVAVPGYDGRLRQLQ